MTDAMFLCLGSAKPSEKNSGYDARKNYPVLVFALSETEQDAKLLASEHLQSTEWVNVVIDNAKKIEVEAINKAEPEIINAYELALKDGSHGMVFGEGA